MRPSAPECAGDDAHVDEIVFRSAEAGDRPAVEALLQACGVAVREGHETLENCLVGEAADEVVGVAAIELHGALGLLRCVAVRPDCRGLGFGKQLAGAAEAFARSHGARELCLMTSAAVPFFGGRGYRVDNRADAPAAIRTSPAFQASCADTAVFMTLSLDARRPAAISIRPAVAADAAAILDIYAPIVRFTPASFEMAPPSVDEMQARIAATVVELPWLVSLDDRGVVNGFAHASRHRDPAAYRWSVDISVHVRQGSREQGIGRQLCEELLRELAQLGYCQALARVALPNEAGIALHRSLGFEPSGVFRKVGFKHGAWIDVSWWQRQLRELPPEPDEPRLPPPTAMVHRDEIAQHRPPDGRAGSTPVEVSP